MPRDAAPWDWNRVLTPRAVLRMLPVVGLLVWAYWQPIMRWETSWRNDDAWGHGYFIPLIAVLIAHYRLQERAPRRIEACVWGLVLMLVGIVLRIWSQTLLFGYPGDVTFVLVVAGVVLWMLGWEMFRALWIPVAYLWLMIPWAPKYYENVALPLQRMAAVTTERFLDILGVQILREGNVLYLRSGPITVAEACSGLRLLFTFVALGVMMAFMYRRPLWERAIIIFSSIPIAVFCNFVRVALMALLSNAIHSEVGRLAGGEPAWAERVPMIAEWPGTAWVGLILIVGGLILPFLRTGFLSRRNGWLVAGALLVGGGIVVARAATIGIGYGTPAQLEELRQTVLDPQSPPHQAFGFAMLGLAFVLMWAELKFIDMLFVAEEDSDEAPPAPPQGAESEGTGANPSWSKAR